MIAPLNVSGEVGFVQEVNRQQDFTAGKVQIHGDGFPGEPNYKTARIGDLTGKSVS